MRHIIKNKQTGEIFWETSICAYAQEMKQVYEKFKGEEAEIEFIENGRQCTCQLQ